MTSYKRYTDSSQHIPFKRTTLLTFLFFLYLYSRSIHNMPPLCIVASMTIQSDAESLAKYESLFLERAAQIYSTEPNVLLFQLCKAPKNPGEYYVIELYKDEAAFKAHLALFKNGAENQAARAALQIGKTAVQFLDVVGNTGFKEGKKPTMAIIAEIPLKDSSTESIAGFEKATLPLMDDVQSKESGNLLYCLGKQRKTFKSQNDYESKCIFTELYTDASAIQLHGSTDYFKAGGKRQAPFIGGKPNVKILQTVGFKPSSSVAGSL